MVFWCSQKFVNPINIWPAYFVTMLKHLSGAGSPRRLHARARTRLVRWLLDPGVEASPEIHAALVRDVDMSMPAIYFSTINFLILGAVFFHISPTEWHAFLLAGNLLSVGLRLSSAMLINKGNAEGRPVLVDIYCLSTIFWGCLQGALAGGAMISESTTLQILAATGIMALQGALFTRNFSVPRFAMTILCASVLPFATGIGFARDHWLLCLPLMMPSYLFGTYSTIKRFQGLSLLAYQERHISQQAALHDPLTGALNRRGVRQAMENGIGHEVLTVFYLDLDAFKQVNDRHGHIAGDRLLRGVVKRLRTVVREGDILGRAGGDEFIIVAPAMTQAAAENFAARLVAQLSAQSYAIGDGLTARIGVSVGFACAPEDSTSLMELTHMADMALCAVKQQGKGSWQRAVVSGQSSAVSSGF
jgi:diguanylate cyclase (GGDEF)-like protein